MSVKASSDGRFSYRLRDGEPESLEATRMFRFQCRQAAGIMCSINVSTAPHVPKQTPPIWQLSGTFDQPTIHPSINCSNDKCWHGFIEGGVFKKVDKTPEAKQ